MAKTPAKYCYRKPKFPANGFVEVLWVLKGSHRLIYPLPQLFTNFSQMRDITAKLVSASDPDEMFVEDQVLIVPLKFERFFPLKAEYWGKSVVKYDWLERSKQFAKMIRESGAFNLLVTPAGRIGQTDVFATPLPFLATTSDSDLDVFMKLSDYPVDTSAKYCAIYSVGEHFGFNLKTFEVSKSRGLLSLGIN